MRQVPPLNNAFDTPRDHVLRYLCGCFAIKAALDQSFKVAPDLRRNVDRDPFCFVCIGLAGHGRFWLNVN